MSNDKTMKLYTEEHVRKAIELARDTHQVGKPYHEREEYDYSIEEVIYLLTPIELPSDEEIEQIADACHPFAEQIGGDIYVAYRGFKQGLQFMRDKIQGGNNEQ